MTFHPKVYLFEGKEEASAIVGSSNLTAGGLYTNLEAAIWLEKLSSKGEEIRELKLFIESICDETKPYIKKITAANLTEILALLPPEATLWKQALSVASKTGNGAVRTATPSIFGSGAFPTAPPLLKAVPTSSSAAPALAPPPSVSAPAATATGAPIGSILGFWKQLSKFDVSPSSAPGQIIIPKEFATLFPPRGKSQTTDSNAVQSDVNLAVRFHGLGKVQLCTAARLILYEPAAHHPRPNIEYRFTFHDKAINPTGLSETDILVFEVLTDDPDNCWFNIYHIPAKDPQYSEIRALASRSFGPLYPATE